MNSELSQARYLHRHQILILKINIMENYKNICEVEISYMPNFDVNTRPSLTSSQVVSKIIRDNWNPKTLQMCESFKVLLLNQSNRLLGIKEISTGGITSCVVDVRLIFAAALKANATAIIITHNHPSGGLNPSRQDIDITKKIIEGGKILDIRVLDHIIITKDSYTSMADEGLMQH